MLPVLAAGIAWDSLTMCLFPGLMLSRAVEARVESLQEEYAESFVYALAVLLEGDEKYSVHAAVSQSLPAVGEVCWDLKGAVVDSPRMVCVDGVLSLAGLELDIGAYLDREEVAFTSKKLLKGGWYGFSLNTIGREIRDNPALSYILGEEISGRITQCAASAKNWINWDMPRISTVQWEVFQNVGMGLFVLDPEVHRCSLDIQGKRQHGFRLSCDISGEEIGAAAASCEEQLPGWALSFAQWMQKDETSALEAEFWVFNGKLYGFLASVMADNVAYRAEVWLDEENTAAILSVQEDRRSCTVMLGPEVNSSSYEQRVLVTWTGEEEKQRTVSCSYRWDFDSGNLWLQLKEGSRTAFGHAHLTQTRLYAATNNLSPLLEILTGEGYGLEKCSLTVTPGASIQKPDYQDFAEWSLDDLFVLLDGVGDVLGMIPE